MAQIWIQEEKITTDNLEEMGQYLRLNGDIRNLYFISDFSDEDNVEKNEKFLQEFLIAQNKYPIYITFVTYDDNEKDFIKYFSDNKLEYKLSYLEEQRTYYTLFKKHVYHPPCFTVKITDPGLIKSVLEETYWLPTQNEFYAISYSENLSFKLEDVKEWGKKKKLSIPNFQVNEQTTFITIFHDGAGFYLFSNEEKFSTLKNLCSHLPEGTVIKQINDTLISE